MNTTPVVVFDMNMIFGLCYMMWAIPTGTGTAFEKKKNQVKSPSPESRTSNSVRIRQSGRSGIRGVTVGASRSVPWLYFAVTKIPLLLKTLKA